MDFDQEVASMNDALAQMRSSGRIYFLKSLPKTACQKGETGKYAELTLPAQFVQEHGDKFEEWVILRTQLSQGNFSRPWVVRLRVCNSAATVWIGSGWHSFVACNHLKEGDSLIFLLKEEVRSEFEVHAFRGPRGSPHFPDKAEYSPTDGGDEDEHFSALQEFKTSSPSLRQPEVEPNKTFITKIRNGKAAPFSHSKHLEKHRMYPGFYKRLTATSIIGSNGDSNAGHFFFPWSFVKTHGDQLHGSVLLQGIHEDSPTYLVTCRRSPQHCLKVHFFPSEWSKFVKENRLKSGHELQFSLVAESYFVVRKA